MTAIQEAGVRREHRLFFQSRGGLPLALRSKGKKLEVTEAVSHL